MPHCIIEYAKALETTITARQMMEKVFIACNDSGLFQTDDIKVRAQSYEHFRVGQGNGRFLHVTLKILDGRTTTQKQDLSQGVLEALMSLSLPNTELTVEVMDTERQCYRKQQSIPAAG